MSNLPDPHFSDAAMAEDMSDMHREWRNTLLKDSDWTQLSDTSLTNEQREVWKTYRQALRDLSAHANWPNLEPEDWPTNPIGN